MTTSTAVPLSPESDAQTIVNDLVARARVAMDAFADADQARVEEGSSPGNEFCCFRSNERRRLLPACPVLDVAFVNHPVPDASAGNRRVSPASLASQMPHSVIRPVTRRAGVTSNA